MSASEQQTRDLARRIAARLSGNTGDKTAGDPFSAIHQRLDQIENKLSGTRNGPPTAVYSPWSPPGAFAPSEEKFDIAEATVAEMVDYFEQTKKCELEPGGKPCDHCSMCSSRGF